MGAKAVEGVPAAIGGLVRPRDKPGPGVKKIPAEFSRSLIRPICAIRAGELIPTAKQQPGGTPLIIHVTRDGALPAQGLPLELRICVPALIEEVV